MKETYERFSQESMQTGWTDQQEIRKDQSTIFQAFKNRFELRQIILHPVLAVLCDSKDSPPAIL